MKKNSTDAIKEIMDLMERNNSIATNPKIKYFEVLSSYTFLLSPPLLTVLAIRQAVIIGGGIGSIMLGISALLLAVGYGWYLYKESDMFRIVKRV
jgi:hypothetical protein